MLWLRQLNCRPPTVFEMIIIRKPLAVPKLKYYLLMSNILPIFLLLDILTYLTKYLSIKLCNIFVLMFSRFYSALADKNYCIFYSNKPHAHFKRKQSLINISRVYMSVPLNYMNSKLFTLYKTTSCICQDSLTSNNLGYDLIL